MSAEQVPGRVVVTAAAYRRMLGAIAADVLGVPRTAPRVEVRDERGALRADVRSPVRLRGGRTVLESAREAGDAVRERGSRLTGAEISAGRIHITSVDNGKERVR